MTGACCGRHPAQPNLPVPPPCAIFLPALMIIGVPDSAASAALPSLHSLYRKKTARTTRRRPCSRPLALPCWPFLCFDPHAAQSYSPRAAFCPPATAPAPHPFHPTSDWHPAAHGARPPPFPPSVFLQVTFDVDFPKSFPLARCVSLGSLCRASGGQGRASAPLPSFWLAPI